MQIMDCKIADLKIIQLDLRRDNRGFLVERFNAQRFAQAGFSHEFVQENLVHSEPGVLRGLHYQYAPPQGKLVGVTRGRVRDVALDIRPDSPTFGQHHIVELSADNGVLFWIPAGFAHGFCVLGDEPADMVYKMDNYYNSEGEGGIRFDDADLNISWPVKQPITSERDRKQQSWSGYKKSLKAADMP